MSEPNGKRSVLFVCLGNICRSPLAEGVFLHLARERGVLDGWRVDSAGTGAWHAGERADGRMRATAGEHGVELPSIARQVDPERDFPDLMGAGGFDHIVVMDRSNLENVLSLGAPPERVRMLGSWLPAGSPFGAVRGPHDAPEVPDPYYGGPEGFDRVYEMAVLACGGMLDELGG